MLSAPSRSVGALATGGAITWVRLPPPPSLPHAARIQLISPAAPSRRTPRRAMLARGTRMRTSSAMSHLFLPQTATTWAWHCIRGLLSRGPGQPAGAGSPGAGAGSAGGARCVGGVGEHAVRRPTAEDVHAGRVPAAPDLAARVEPLGAR